MENKEETQIQANKMVSAMPHSTQMIDFIIGSEPRVQAWTIVFSLYNFFARSTLKIINNNPIVTKNKQISYLYQVTQVLNTTKLDLLLLPCVLVQPYKSSYRYGFVQYPFSEICCSVPVAHTCSIPTRLFHYV